MACLRIVVSLLAVIAAAEFARAQVEPTPMDDEARLEEKYAIQPGAEPLFSDMLGLGQTLPGGCTLSEGKIERTSAVGTYTCGEKRVVLQLLHPTLAPYGAVRTQRMAVAVTSGTAPSGLVDAIADRVRAREGEFAWTEVGEPNRRAPKKGSPVGIAGIAVAAIVGLWVLRRLAAMRKRSA